MWITDDSPPIDLIVPKAAEEDGEKTNDIPVCCDDNLSDKLLGDNSKIESLVFKAKIAHDELDSSSREFVVKYFLSDQSFSVSETNVQTAGR